MLCAWQLAETDFCYLLCHQSDKCDRALSDLLIFFLFFFLCQGIYSLWTAEHLIFWSPFLLIHLFCLVCKFYVISAPLILSLLHI